MFLETTKGLKKKQVIPIIVYGLTAVSKTAVYRLIMILVKLLELMEYE